MEIFVMFPDWSISSTAVEEWISTLRSALNVSLKLIFAASVWNNGMYQQGFTGEHKLMNLLVLVISNCSKQGSIVMPNRNTWIDSRMNHHIHSKNGIRRPSWGGQRNGKGEGTVLKSANILQWIRSYSQSWLRWEVAQRFEVEICNELIILLLILSSIVELN